MGNTASDFGSSFEQAIFYMAPHNHSLFQALDKLAYVGTSFSDEEKVSPETREDAEEYSKEDQIVSPKERTIQLRRMLAKRETTKRKASKGKSGVMEQPDRKDEEELQKEEDTQKVARLSRVAYLSH